MKKEILTLNQIFVNKNRIRYNFQYSDSISQYFSGEPFEIDYPDNVETVPPAVLAIPFVMNVLPLIWLKDFTLRIPELDLDFYNSIPNFKKGYIDMYPKMRWAGKIEVERLIDTRQAELDGAVAFFSGGVDATTTVFRHYNEKLDLLAIWGSDIAYDNQEGWFVMEKGLINSANDYHLPFHIIHSAFRKFDNEHTLHTEFFPKLHDDWWHGVKHGIGLIGHAAPYVWLHKKKSLYIASSNCPADGHVTCASHPTIDNYVRFCGCTINHDGFELSRQDKIAYLVQKHNALQLPVNLHVCWESDNGKNCCSCEKCFRTITGFWAEGADPKGYGFDYDEKTICDSLYALMALNYQYKENIIRQWKHIQDAVRLNWSMLVGNGYADRLKWMLDFDFDSPNNNKCRKKYWAKIRRTEYLANKFSGLYRLYKKIVR